MDAAARLDVTFAALADPTRRAILARLATGEASVMELAAPFALSQPAISKHLKVLERAGLISRGRDATRRPCRIEAAALGEANAYLERYRRLWEARFVKLDAVLDDLKQHDLEQHDLGPDAVEPDDLTHAERTASATKRTGKHNKKESPR